jgi:hypothetical protein
MAKTEKRKLQFLDIYLSAYLSLCGIPPKLETNNGKVVFVFPATDDVYRLLSDYNSDVEIPVVSFVTQVKALRGQMLTMRGQR